MDRALTTSILTATLFGLSAAACSVPSLGASKDEQGGRPSGLQNISGENSGNDMCAGVQTRPVGVVTCQPAFEQACKPQIIVTNDDPDGRGRVLTDVIPNLEEAEQEIACTACSILYRDPSEIPAERRLTTINLKLDTHGGVAQAGGNNIQFDLDYIAGWKDKDPAAIKQEMLGVLQHETVHLYQWYGITGTGEGMADLVRARTGYYSKDRWKYQGTWKDPYTNSGNFYSWLTGPSTLHNTFFSNSDPDFPYKMNKALVGVPASAAYDAVSGLIQNNFGRSVDDLWSEYEKTAFVDGATDTASACAPAAAESAAATSISVSWPFKTPAAEYSLDVQEDGSEWTGPCISAGILHKSLSTVFSSCPSGKHPVDVTKITAFRICWAENGNWAHASCKTEPYAGESSVSFSD